VWKKILKWWRTPSHVHQFKPVPTSETEPNLGRHHDRNIEGADVKSFLERCTICGEERRTREYRWPRWPN